MALGAHAAATVTPRIAILGVNEREGDKGEEHRSPFFGDMSVATAKGVRSPKARRLDTVPSTQTDPSPTATHSDEAVT